MSDESLAIAVVGMACRFPGAPNVDALWALLRDGIEPAIDLTDEEILAAGVDAAVVRDPAYVKRGTVLEEIDRFDARFFGYARRDAALMDPQHRLFLETAWHALEHAGHGGDETAGPVAVFAGASLNTYALNNLYPDRDFVSSMEDLQALMSVDKDFLATRVAYHLNLTGPAVVVQATCATSLVAVCQACQSLRHYGCDLAIAGGVSVRVPQRRGYLCQPGGILSPDGRCRAFDARAAGTFFSNGVGAVVLRRLEDALADGDNIHAVIRGWATNNDGAAKVGYTAPSLDGQTAVIALAQEFADVDPATIGCIEAHGTGTPLGDPIEVAALTRAFRRRTDRCGYCALGTIKSNLGHLDAAAGIAGLLKMVMALKNGRIPPTLHFEGPNPNIDIASSPFYVAGSLGDWPALGAPRRAGVSSFGIGGTNAHVVLEEALAAEAAPARRARELIVLSAKTPAALAAQAADLADHFAAEPKVVLADAAHTLQTGRRAFAHRHAAVCGNTGEAVAALRAQGRGAIQGLALDGARIAFLFPGQGEQYAGMGGGLYEGEREFHERVDECAAILEPELGLDLRDVLYGGSDPSRITRTELAQPALFTVEYALACTWMAWGVRPAALLGHSVGEYVAACVAGVLGLDDALRLIALRGRLMLTLAPGAMLAVPLAPETLAPWLDERLAIAATNAPDLSVVSGPTEAVEALAARLREVGIASRRLRTSHAFHSPMVEPILDEFAEAVRRVELRAPRIPYISNVTGGWINEGEACDPAYWTAHLRRTVRFAEGLETLLAEPGYILLEVGPGRALGALARRRAGATVPVVSSMRDARDARPDVECLLEAAGRLWVAGVELDWSAFRDGERRRRVPLPGYRFERERHWVDPVRAGGPRSQAGPTDPADRFYVPSWRRSMVPAAAPPKRTRWLVLCEHGDMAEQVAARLTAEGSDVTTVRAGTAFSRAGEREYTLDPLDPQAYESLVARLAAEERLPERVLHGWAAPGGATEPRAADGEVEFAFLSPLFLARALGHSQAARRVELVVLTRGAHDVIGTEPLVPERSTALGVCRVVPRELPGLACRNVDIEADGNTSARMIDLLVAELRAGGDPVVAYRGGHRWVEGVERVRLAAPAGAPACLRERGVYLITGGLGGLGIEIGAYLARAVRARLVLCSRNQPDARQRQRLAEIESLGGEVEVIAADVAREGELARVFERARARFGAVHGAIHAAGVARAAALDEVTRESAAAVLAPKLAGTRALADLCTREGCELLVLFSSTASLLGGVGQAEYCAANAGLDALGTAIARSFPAYAVVIGWHAWADVGMAARAVERLASGAARAALSREALSPAEGVDAFARVLAARCPRVLVSAANLAARVEESPRDAPRLAIAPQSETDSEIALDGRERLIAEVWRDLLGVARVGPESDFFELGGHSLLATQMLNRLRQRVAGVDLRLEDVFAAPTVAGLARRIAALTHAAEPEQAAVGVDDGERVAGVVVVLCTPRSGSTLLRLMLSANPRLFAPPELWLLGYETMREWNAHPLAVVYRNGLVRALAELGGPDSAAPVEAVDRLVRSGAAVRDVYRVLVERAAGRLLVDKTPGYVLHPATLARAEALFDGARYLHLVRHPAATIESFVRARFDRFLDEPGDPCEHAERIWITGNSNARDFLAGIPAERRLELRYESLVGAPAAVMEGLCAFLGVPFVEDMLRPYERGRMINGPGDPGLRTHSAIDPSLADAWRQAGPAALLALPARELAVALGYEVPA